MKKSKVPMIVSKRKMIDESKTAFYDKKYRKDQKEKKGPLTDRLLFWVGLAMLAGAPVLAPLTAVGIGVYLYFK